VKIPAYSSLAAFLAHYRALKSAASRSSNDQELLAEMTTAVGALTPETRAALESTDGSANARRHRERAELQLRRELVKRGIVAG